MTHVPTQATGFAAEYEQVTGSLKRATWTIAIALAGIAGALWIGRAAAVRREAWATDNRETTRLALAAELAATTRESSARLALGLRDSTAASRATHAGAEVAANLDSLADRVAGDAVAVSQLQSIRKALEDWESQFGRAAVAQVSAAPQPPGSSEVRKQVLIGTALFARVSTRFEEFGERQNALYRDRLLRERRIASRGALLLLAGIALLVALAWRLRRQVSIQVARALNSHRTIEEQHLGLRRYADTLETQTRQLQDQASELEVKGSHLEEQTLELEMTLEELRESERQQHTLADETQRLNRRLLEAQRVAQLGYWEIDKATGDVFWSDEMYRFCGMEPGTLPVPTEQYLECVHPDDRAQMQLIASQAVQELREFTEQYRITASDGRTRVVQATGRVVADALDGTKLIGTVQDISERIRLESHLRQSQKLEAIGRLAGGIAHDFNNLLTVIAGFTEILLAARAGDAERDSLDEIKKAAARAADLTRQLLAFSRQQVLRPHNIDTNAVISAAEKMLRRLVGEDIIMSTSLDPDLGWIHADPGQIEQVLMNLVANARDAMPSGGTLTIETHSTELDENFSRADAPGARTGYVAIVVSDSGMGMSAEIREHIFDPFYTTKDAGKGTGLGLATVHGIVEQSGGRIFVYSEPGHGSTFKIYFPVATGTADSAPLTTDHAPATLRGTESILVIEDDAAVRRVTASILSRAGYSIVEAADGAEGLRIFESNVVVDAVLTDMVMPTMDGRELARAVRARRPGTPMVFMSGYSRALITDEALIANARFVDKPFSAESLLRAVRDVLDQRPSVGS